MEDIMVAVKGTDLKNNFKSICDRAFMGEAIIISRPKNENVVLISEREYAEFEKAKRNFDYLAKIDRAIEQRNRGTMKEHELIDA
jgi:antitoxin YefM